ncbi:MAG: hypothetical protein NZ888_03230 [Candidatus Nitrosocaldus sp.]|nr:hypothetical protein [Candidatus Nitrosocaldus sp.]MDW8000212.1 hypothetical protein [Candidatus Nitrosocaldus sp.]
MHLIGTGSRALDALLLGGVRRGLLYSVFGASGSGKTQLCMQLALNAARGMHDDARVLIVDAKGDFRPERMLEMDRMGMHGESYYAGRDEDKGRDGCDASGEGCRYGLGDGAVSFMDRVYVQRAYDVDGVLDSLRYVDRMYERHTVPLVIVEDSPSLFRLEYGSKSAEGHFRLMRLMHDLALRAVLRNTAVVVTNGIASAAADGMYGGESSGSRGERQIMDRSVSMFSHFRIRLERYERREGNSVDGMVARVFKATLLQPLAKNNTALFGIEGKGIVDVI